VKGSGALIAGADQANVGAVRLLLGHGEKTAYLNLEEVEECGAYDGGCWMISGSRCVWLRGGKSRVLWML